MKIALIGSSGHKNYVLDTLDDCDEIVAYAPGTPEEDVSSLAGHPSMENARYYGDWKVLIDEARPEMVVNNTWYGLAAPITLYALKKDCHVFAEKPLTGTVEELDEMEALWKEKGVYLSGMFGISYEAPLYTLSEYLDNNDIGDIRIINTQKSYKLGKRADFCKERDTYTGTIPWVGAHGIDWIYRYGKKSFREINAWHSTVANGGNGSLEATAVCSYKLEGEALATLTIDFLRPSGAETHGDDRTRVVGTRAVVEAKEGRVTVVDEKGTRELPLLESPLIFPSLMKDIREKKNREEWAYHALYVTRICLKSRQSADEGRTLSL
nr:Gfo/Idh/MocA family oxidoreductase [uncultured Sphaerochaeta sp.]